MRLTGRYCRVGTEEEIQRRQEKEKPQPGQDHAMKWSRAVQLEIESMLLEVHRDIKKYVKRRRHHSK